MADEVATVSSRPALGFAAVLISDQSYSGGAPDGRGRGFVNQSDCQPDEQEFAELPAQIRQRHLLADAHRAVARAGDVDGHEERQGDAELQAFDNARAALVALGVNP